MATGPRVKASDGANGHPHERSVPMADARTCPNCGNQVEKLYGDDRSEHRECYLCHLESHHHGGFDAPLADCTECARGHQNGEETGEDYEYGNRDA